MKKLVGFLFLFSMLGASLGVHAANPGEGKWVAEQIYRGVNSNGMTGLIHMNSAYTVQNGEMAFTVGRTTFDVLGIQFSTTPASITYGLSNSSELGLFFNPVDSSAPQTLISGAADADIKFKWRFRNQSEYMPAMSIMVGATKATATILGVEESMLGLKIHLLAASEASITDTFSIGMYIDVGSTSYRYESGTDPTYSETNFGLLFPISDNNKTQLIFEINTLNGTIPTVGSVNLTATTYGFRYASTGLKITLGVQSISDGTGTTNRSIGTLGYHF